MLNKIVLFLILIVPLELQSKRLNLIDTEIDGKIRGAIDVSISDDDRFVYVAGFNGCCDRPLVTFERDIASGALNVIQTKPELYSIGRTYAQILSKDQANIYAVAGDDDELSVLSRDQETGLLTEIQNLKSFEEPEFGLSNTQILAESLDEQYILVSGTEISISVFRRDSTTGELEHVFLWENDSGANFGWELTDIKFLPESDIFYVSSITGIAAFQLNESSGEISFLWAENGNDNELLNSIRLSYEMEINPSTNDVYLASRSGLHVFSSDINSGELALKQFIEIEEFDGTVVLPRKLQLNNGSLYFAIGEETNNGEYEKNGVIQYDINDDDGLLTQVDSLFNRVDMEHLHAPMDIEFSADNKSAYIPSFTNNGLWQFDLDSSNGELNSTNFTNASNGVRGMESPDSIVASNDSKFIYVNDFEDGIASFEFDSENESLTFVENVSPYELNTGGAFNSGAISPDGKHYYLVEGYEGKIHLFNRSQESGILTFSQTFSDDASWIEGINNVTSFKISEDGKFAYVTHSNSDWLITVLSINQVDGSLTLVERHQNNIYDNAGGVGTFYAAVYSQLLPTASHYLVYSNSGQLALFLINELTGELELTQLMENEIFDIADSRIAEQAIGLSENHLFLPYDASIEGGVLVAELDEATNKIRLKNKYIFVDEEMKWRNGYQFVLNSAADKAYLTIGNGSKFIVLDVDDNSGELAVVEGLSPEYLSLPDLNTLRLTNIIKDDYVLGIDSYGKRINLFRTNTAPEFTGMSQDYVINIGENLKIEFSEIFSDIDNDELTFEVQGTLPDWMILGASSIQGTPNLTGIGAAFSINVSDGIDEITVEFTVQVINSPPEFIGTTQEYSVDIGEYLKIDFSTLFTDINNHELSFEVQGDLPGWLAVSDSFVDGTPEASDIGATFTLVVSDGIEDTLTEFTINVINTPPEFVGESQNYSIKIGENLNIDLAALFSDLDNEVLTFSVEGSLPSWLTFDTSTLEGTPGGSDTGVIFSVIASDEVNSISIEFSIEVLNTPPVFIGSNNFSVNVDQSIIIDLASLFSDIDSNTLTYSVVGSIPSWLTLDATSLSGIPKISNSDVEVVLNASDGVNSVEARIIISIVKPAPVNNTTNEESSGGGGAISSLLCILLLLSTKRKKLRVHN